MKKGRFLWSAHRITEKQKVRKARNIKEKQLKNSRSTVSKLHVVHRSSASDNRLLRLYQNGSKSPENQRIMFIGTQCDLWGRPDGTGYEKISRGNFPRLIFSLIPSLSERQHFIGYADLIHDSRRICYPAKAGTKVVQPVPPRSAASFSSERVNK